MKIIYRYITQKFVTTFIFTLGLFILIAVVFDISEKIDNFIENQAPLEAIIFDYYLNFIPYFINLFSPLFIFISAIYFTSRMASNTEFIPILTSGMNFYKLLYPYLLVGIVLGMLSFYLNGWVIPRGNKDLIDFEMEYLKSPYLNSNYKIHRQIANNVFIFFDNFNYRDSIGYEFTMEKFKNTDLTYRLKAKKATWNSKSQNWTFTDYNIRKIKGYDEKYIQGDTLTMDLPMDPGDFGRKKITIRAMTNHELDQFIEKEKMRGEENVNYYIVEREKRLAMPFATIVLVAMALAISSRRVRGGMGMHLGLGLLFAFTYILLMQFSTTFAIQTNFSPLLSVWIPNILFGIFTVFLLLIAPK